MYYHQLVFSQKSRGNTVACTVNNRPVKEEDTLCNEQHNEIIVICILRGTETQADL